MDVSNGGASPGAIERLEGLFERARESAPSLTAGLVLASLMVGALGGAWVSKPIHRWQINKEWRERIASKSEAVRDIIAKGDAASDELDRAIIAELGVTDARLHVAEQGLANAFDRTDDDACRIPAGRLRR